MAPEPDPGPSDPEADPNIHPLGQLDCRYPVARQDSVPAGLQLMAEYFATLAARDAPRLVELLHFPFATYEGIDVVVVGSPEQLLSAPPRSLDFSPEHLPASQYDVLDGIELHLYNPVGAALSMRFSRFGPGGHKVGASEGVYAVTNNDGRWAIELASTIFTPAGSIGVAHEDAVLAALRRGRDWMLGYNRRDQSMLNSTHQLGRRANIGLGNPRVNAANARGGDPMGGYKVAGVKSRLRITEATAESIAAADADFEQFAGWAGGGVGQWGYTVNLPEARVLHSSDDKAHTFGGYVRYTSDHRPISETHSLGIMTYNDGRWGSSGGIGVVMYHDYTNDL